MELLRGKSGSLSDDFRKSSADLSSGLPAGCFCGAMLSLEAVWAISDLLNLLMAIPNVAAVLLLQTVVVEKERNYFKLHKNQTGLKE